MFSLALGLDRAVETRALGALESSIIEKQQHFVASAGLLGPSS